MEIWSGIGALGWGDAKIHAMRIDLLGKKSNEVQIFSSSSIAVGCQ